MQEIQTLGGATMFEIVDGDRRLRSRHHAPALKCPRCDSMNTKFCYYNNYNLSQPRHFCKTCRRYWTKGGVLRNVPIGGGCRKNKRYKPKRSTSNKSLPEKKSSSNSSGENSSKTSEIYSSAELLSGFSCSSFMIPETSTSSAFDSSLIDQSSLDLMTFPEIGGFSSLISDSSILSYDVHTGWPFQSNQEGEMSQEWLMISAGEDLNAQDRAFGTEWKDESRGGGSEPSICEKELMFLSDTVDQAYCPRFE